MKNFLLVMVLALPSQLRADLYDCSIEKTREGEWISSRIMIDHNPDTGKVLVSDVTILALARGTDRGRCKDGQRQAQNLSLVYRRHPFKQPTRA